MKQLLIRNISRNNVILYQPDIFDVITIKDNHMIIDYHDNITLEMLTNHIAKMLNLSYLDIANSITHKDFNKLEM